MKKYTLKYRTGWGENISMEFKATNINTALLIARNYCRSNFIYVGWLYSPKGKRYIV